MRRGRIWIALLAAGALAAPAPASAAARAPTPVLAYYYIWFNASSWNRAKTDYPLLGHYSSDERSVMERHVRWAKQAGIDGFVVSWKSTPLLDARLRTLVDVATQEHFALSIIYQGLDFHRRPLPADRVLQDLQAFERRYAHAAPFRLWRAPLVVWSGTWRFTPAEVARVTRAVRPRLLVLASEKNVRGYERLARSVDGDAYYWSSADPLRTPTLKSKLQDMGRAVRRRRGLWIAPAAAGFDARLIGGTKTVPRRHGATLRAALDIATGTEPDAIGLISWNEYSENSHVEPSQRYGFEELRTIADVLGAHVPSAAGLDSSEGPPTGSRHGLPLIGGFVAVLLGGAALMSRRRRAAHRDGTSSRAGAPVPTPGGPTHGRDRQP